MIFCGPWIGEFGWELFCWQGYLRKLAHNGNNLIIGCRTGHEFLYEDFTADFVNYNPTNPATDMWKCRGEKLPDFLTNLKKHIPHNVFKERWWINDPHGKQQVFHRYTSGSYKKTVDILFIVRATDKCNTGFRNWPITHAKVVASALQSCGYTIGCVGRSGSALSIPGTTNLLDLPLCDLASVMNRAKVIVGPQCGPTHFASLCGLPQVCWQTKKEHADRAKHYWNPFNVSVHTLCSPNDEYWIKRQEWTPPVTSILGHVVDLCIPNKNEKNG